MTSYPLTWLADVLRAAGCRVIEEGGWKTRGRPSSTGTFAPRALLRHWDASSPGSHSTSVLINGNGSAPGPLCSIWTCAGNSDHAPSVHVIAAGRCNHGGEGDGWGAIPRDDANTYAVGHEIRQTVDKPWPADQLEQVRMAEAAILKRLGAATSNGLCSHSEYAPDRKIDTTEGDYGQNMNNERTSVAGYMSGTPTGGDDLRNIFANLSNPDVPDLSTSGIWVKWSSEGSDSDGMHDAGEGAVNALFPCTMSGVANVHVVEEHVDVEVQRVTPDGTESRVGHAQSLGVGYHNVPFVGKLSKGDRLYLRLSRHDTGAVSDCRLTVQQLERV
jgi:hypothetical protein